MDTGRNGCSRHDTKTQNCPLRSIFIATPWLCWFDSIIWKKKSQKSQLKKKIVAFKDKKIRPNMRKLQETTAFSGLIWKSWQSWQTFGVQEIGFTGEELNKQMLLSYFRRRRGEGQKGSKSHDPGDQWICFLISNASFMKEIGHNIYDGFISICCEQHWKLERHQVLWFCPQGAQINTSAPWRLSQMPSDTSTLHEKRILRGLI